MSIEGDWLLLGQEMDDDVAQNSDEWLLWRRGGLGASDLPIIMQTVDWSTPFQLYEEKLGLRSGDFSSFVTDRGHALEPIARKKYNELNKCEMVPKLFTHATDDWARCSLDGWQDSLCAAIEIKCVGKDTHQCAKDGEVPAKYLPQLYWQMYVTNAKWIDYVSYYVEQGGDYEKGDLAIVRLHQDPQKISEVYAAGFNFWQCVVNKVPPEFTDRDEIELTDANALDLAKQYLDLTNEIKALQSAQKVVKDKIIQMAQIHARVKLGPVHVTRTTKKGAIDYKKFSDDEGLDLEEYRKPDSTYYTLRIKEE